MNIQDLVKDEVKEVGSVIGGLVGGALLGTCEAAVLPSYLRSKVSGKGYSAMIPSEPKKMNYDSGKFNARFSGVAHLSRPLFRWGSSIAAVVDLADGQVENFGYMAIPFGISLGVEVVSAVWNKYQKRVPR
jgi:hypothetical protein